MNDETEIKELRLAWEPTNQTPLSTIEERMVVYTRNTKWRGGTIILGNGTLLFIPEGGDDLVNSQKALNEARFLTDFHVMPLKEGGYMVDFHDAVVVFVGQEEFEQMKEEIAVRQGELKFPGETFFPPSGTPPFHTLIGLYARGKLQYDAYHFNFYKRV